MVEQVDTLASKASGASRVGSSPSPGTKEDMTVDKYLKKNGYASVEDWALDSDMEQREGVWYDSNDNPIDIEEYLGVLIAEGIAQ